MGDPLEAHSVRQITRSVPEHNQKVKVPLPETLSFSIAGNRSCEQLPSGARCRMPRALTEPVPVPVAPLNMPVPPSKLAACVIVNLARHDLGSILAWKPRLVLTRWSVPSGNTRSSRLTLSGSVGRFGTSTILPTPSNTPVARIDVARTTRSPDKPLAMRKPSNLSAPEV